MRTAKVKNLYLPLTTRKFLLVLSISGFCYVSGYGQQSAADDVPGQGETQPRMNIIHANGAVLGPDVMVSAMGWYERFLWPKPGVHTITTFARVGYRGGATWLIGPVSEPVGQVGLLTGRNAWHFEFAVGGTPPSLSDSQDITVTAGVRYQKFHNPLVVRAGAGLPEGLYFGLGFSF